MENYKPEVLEQLDHECSLRAKEYSEYVYQDKAFSVLSQSFLAALKMKIRGQISGQKASDAELEMRARSTDEWNAFSREQLSVLQEAGRHKIMYEDACRRWETQKSIMAFKREEFRKL